MGSVLHVPSTETKTNKRKKNILRHRLIDPPQSVLKVSMYQRPWDKQTSGVTLANTVSPHYQSTHFKLVKKLLLSHIATFATFSFDNTS